MSLRKSALDVSLFTLGGVDFKGTVKSWDFNTEVITDDCRVAVERYHAAIAVKKRLEFTISRIPHVADACQSNLDISVFSVGGTSYLGALESGSMRITTDGVDGSGVADLWEFINAVGSDVEIQTTLKVSTQAALFQLASANNSSGVAVEVILTIGETTVTLPMTMSAASHKIEEGALQMQDVTFKLRGTPVDVDGDAMVIEILTGDAYVSWAIDSEAGQYSGNAIITQTTLSFNNSQLQSLEHTLVNQGAPSITTS